MFQIGDRVITLPVKTHSDDANAIYAGKTGVVSDVIRGSLQGICYDVHFDEPASCKGYPIRSQYYYDYENGLRLLREHYVANVEIDEEGCDLAEYSCSGGSGVEVKENVKDVIWRHIELANLGQDTCFLVCMTIENGYGDFVDHDEFYVTIDKMVRTEQPSQFIKWDAQPNKPHIFTVDREQSKLVFSDD